MNAPQLCALAVSPMRLESALRHTDPDEGSAPAAAPPVMEAANDA